MQTYKTIQYEQRVLIAQYLKDGFSQSVIAQKLGFHRSVICREIKRNKSTGSYGLYNAKQAQARATSRSSNKGRKSKINGAVKRAVNKKLRNNWSPEQIAGRAKLEGMDLGSHETIYLYVYKDKRAGGGLYTHLRQARRTRRKRSTVRKRRGTIKDRVSIKERDEVVEQRTRLGDWEGDTIVGKSHKTAIATMVDRTSKQTKIMKLKSRTAKETAKKITKKMADSKQPIHTITFDNGKEFSEHKKIAKGLDAKVYFADPYSAYQRGTNENTNGLIRQYLPKKTDFATVDHYELKKIENALNNRPRKSLNYLTPNEYIRKSVAINS